MQVSTVNLCQNDKVALPGYTGPAAQSCTATGDHQFLVIGANMSDVKEFFLCNAHFRAWHEVKRKAHSS